MSPALQSWLHAIPDFHGLLAAYVVIPQQEPEVRSWSPDFNDEAILTMHRQVQDVLDVLDAGKIPARKLRWIFEKAVVYLERRKDGAGMCLITTHDPWVGEGDNITDLISDFRTTV